MAISQIIVATASSSTGPQHSETGTYIWNGQDYDGSNFVSTNSTGYPLNVVGGYTGNPTVGNGSWGGTINSYWMNFDNNGSTNNYGFYTPNLNQYGGWKVNYPTDPSFTVQLWFYPTTLGTVLVGMNENGVGPFLNNMLEINTDGHVYAQLWENSQSGSPLISTTAAVQNTWNHVFLQYNVSAQTLTMSVNNDTPAILTSFTPVVLPTNNNMAFLLGQNTANKMTFTGDLPFRGRIAYLKVVNHSVSSDFIDQRNWFYNTYTPPVYGNGSLGGSIYFNGTTSYLQVPITSTGLRFAPGTSDYTIEWWQYMTAEGSWPYPFSIWNPDTGVTQLSAYFQYGQIQLSDADHTNVAFGTGLNSIILNKWAHIAIVRDNGYMTVYVNGVAINDPLLYNWPTNITNLGPSGAKFTIGGQIDAGGSTLRSGTPFSGIITNFNFINGLAKYTSGFVPSAIPFTVESGVVTKMLLLASTEANVIYDTAASHNVLSSTDVSWSSASPFVVPYLWLDAANTNSWTPHSMSGSIRFVKSNTQYINTTVAEPGAPETPTTIAISGADFTAVNLTYTRDIGQTTPTWYPAGYNPSTDPYILFDNSRWEIWNPGFGQPIYVNSGSITAPLTQWSTNPPLGSVAPTGVYTPSANLTYEWWFYPTSVNGTQGMLQTRTNTTAGDGIDVSIVDNTIYITTSGSVLFSGGTVTPLTWYHIALVRVSDTWTVYLNGTSLSGTFNFTNTTGTELYIGEKSADTSSECFDGYITNFRYIKGTAYYTGNFNVSNMLPLTAVTGTQLLLSAVVGANFLVDSSVNNHTMTNNNGAITAFINPFDVWRDLGVGGHNATFPNSVTYSASNSGILQFDAADSQYAVLPDLGNTLKFSINAWYNLTSLPSGTNPCIFTERFGSNVINYMLGFTENSTDIAGGFFAGGFHTAGSGTATTATWVNLTVTYDGATVKMYVGGTLYASTSYSATPVNSGLGSYIARRWDNLETIDGSIPVVQLYNYALSATEVTALYDKFSPRY